MEYKRYEKYNDSGIEWIGEIPEQWQVKKIKYCSKIYGRIGFRGYTVEDLVLEGEGAVTLSPSNIDNQKLIFNKKTYISWEKYYESPEIMIYNGDILLVKTASVGKVAFVQGLSEKATINPQFVVFKDVSINNKFLYYVMISENLQRQIKMATYGGVVGTLTQQEISNYLLVGPISIQEQITISTFLDKKTSEIDDLIAEKEKLIELLQEQRQAIITEAVTKGLTPNVKMKDSGIEWIGEIPEHWEVKKIKYLSNILRGKFNHRPRNDPDFYDGEYPFIQTGDISNANKFVIDYSQTLNDKGFSVSKQFPKGTLVMTIAANIGDLAIINYDACFPDSIVGFLPKKGINVEYLYYLFSAMKPIFLSTATLNTQLNLNVERVGALLSVVPGFSEQVEIVSFLNDMVYENEDIVKQLSEQISNLKAYRQSLISEAVTGKIDVRGYSA